MRRLLTTVLAASFIAAALIPLVNASTEMTSNGDVIINGAFQNDALRGHPRKLYCDANNPGAPAPCEHRNQFVAYDWTAPVADAANVTLSEQGISLKDNAFIQQHFNGSEAPDRMMEFYHMTLTGFAHAPGTGGLRAELRVDVGGTIREYTKSVSFGTTPTTIDLLPADLKYAGNGLPSGELKMRSVRLWSDAAANLTLTRVAVYATNGVEGRNLHILPGGDDVVTTMNAAAMISPSTDGKFTFVVGMADDAGDFLPTRDAWICAYHAEQARTDMGYPDNAPELCMGAFLQSDDPAITKTDIGDAFRFDIAASALTPGLSANPTFAIYAIVKVDGAYDIETPAAGAEYKSGYYHIGRVAADAADIGVSNEFYGPTPVFVDANTDGVPDYAQADEIDGYSVIITPRRAIESPAATVVGATPDGFYEFEVSVYDYEGTAGEPMTLTHGLTFALFNGSGLVNGGAFDADPFWASEGDASQSLLPGGKSVLVRVPADEMPAEPVGAWAFYDVEQPYRWNAASEPFGGYSQSATDFYSAVRNSVKEHAAADALRTAGTPILFDSVGATSASTTVIRMDPEADELTALDGTLVVSDGGDGSVTFEYALVDSAGVRLATEHGFAIYDAAGAISDDLQPGAVSMLEHAEWTGQGVLTDDGWLRIEVPLSAFADAQGPVGAWAYAHDATSTGTLCCSTWYNPLKASVAALAPSVADVALYGPTPIVILDNTLGIPAALASAMQSAGNGILSVTNPLVNPGFEADLQVEGRRDTTDNTGAVMTTPPWFFRLDDGANGGGQPTNPRSTHEVSFGQGRLGDAALKIRYNIQDDNKGLMLGQLLGAEAAGKGLVWRGATGAALDVKTESASPIVLTASLRWLNETDVVKQSFSTKTVQPSLQWQRVSFPLSVPANSSLLGFYVSIDSSATSTFYLDNVVLEGAKTALGDSRTDLSDGYAVVIQPQELDGAIQALVQGAGGLGYYLYDVEVIDYTDVSPHTLVTANLAKSFGLRGPDALAKDLGTILRVRGEDDVFVAALPATDAPGTPAAPWAWVAAGDAYNPLGAPVAMQPASGYYSPVKNALAGSSIADQLDYAGTPVRFGDTVGREQLGEQQISLAPAPGGGWLVRVEADTPFVETTTVTLSRPNVMPQSFPVTLATASGDIVPGLVIPDELLASTTVSSADSLFTAGDVLVAGSPSATWQVCRAVLEGCQDSGIESLETLIFRATAVNPAGEAPLTYVWRFGDGTTRTTTQTDVQHAYSTPGTKTVNLTVQAPSGRKGWYEGTVTVENLLPTIQGLDITPTPVNTDDLVTLRARASDPDNGNIVYTWRLDGVVIPGQVNSSVRLTPDVLGQVLPAPALELGTYNVSVTIVDGQGSPPLSAARDLVVVPRAPELSALQISVDGVENTTYALPGETVLVTVNVADPDAQATGILLREADGLVTEIALTGVDGVYTGSFVAPAPTRLALRAVATTAGDEVLGPAAAFDVLEDAETVVTIAGPTLVEVGDEAAFSVTVVDPDNRTTGVVTWQIDGVDAAGDGANLTTIFSEWGYRTVTATVGTVTATHVVGVDDFVTVTMEIVQAAQNVTDGNRIRVTVLDADGNGIVGEDVVIQDFVDMIPTHLRTVVVTTGAGGVVEFEMEPEAGVLSLPLAHRLLATVSASSVAGAPDPGFEVATAEITYDNAAGPWAIELLA